MAKSIAFFNHKGGVSKTTNVFHFGWMLSDLGYTVLLVDADPQCNLTGLILSEGSFERFEKHYMDNPSQNLKAGVQPVFDGALRPLEPVEPLPVNGQDRLFLLPGHLELSEYDITLTLAHELSGSVHALKNVPGATSELINLTCQSIDADYALIDLNPSLSSINQNLFLTSDAFVIPNSPDYFSLMAIKSLSRVLPLWSSWLDKAVQHPALQDATYKITPSKPIFAGSLIQNFRLRKGEPTQGYQQQMNDIFSAIDRTLVPELARSGLALSEEQYRTIIGEQMKGHCIGLVPDFNTLVTYSHTVSTPVFDLPDKALGAGSVLTQNQIKRSEFYSIYKQACEQMAALLS